MSVYFKACIIALIIAPLSLCASAQEYKLSGNTVVPSGTVAFKPGTATLQPSGEAALGAIAQYMTDKSYISTLRVESHAGDQSLSEARALAICKWLSAHGTDCGRLVAVGFGNTKPEYEGGYEEDGISGNVRIVFANAALKGTLIGGMPADGGGKVAGSPCR